MYFHFTRMLRFCQKYYIYIINKKLEKYGGQYVDYSERVKNFEVFNKLGLNANADIINLIVTPETGAIFVKYPTDGKFLKIEELLEEK